MWRRRRARPWPLVELLLASWLAASCELHGRDPTPRFVVEGVGISLPRLDGWRADPTIGLKDPAASGIALRLVLDKAPVASPHIDVNVEARSNQPITLDSYLDQNLRAMGQLETHSQSDPTTRMRITRVSQQPFKAGLRRAYLVRHEYTLGSGAMQMAFTQLSAALVVDGRGVTITAVGRTELFHPFAEPITRILTGVRATADPATPTTDRQPAAPPPPPQRDAEPVDLGTVGGK